MPSLQNTIRKAPTPSELIRLLKPNPDLQKDPSDQIIPKSLVEPDVDEDYLSEELVRNLRECIHDRETFDFERKRRYDDESYFGIKDTFFDNWPWPGASNFQEPIIPTMVDVGYTHIHAAMFRDKMKTVVVNGVGKEDRPYAPLVAHVLNYQNGVESNAYEAHISNAFRTVQKGTGFLKTWVDFGDFFKIRHASIPMELIYKPIRGSGCQRGDTWIIHQLIPMSVTDWKFRQGLRMNGKSIYRHLDMIAPGFGPGEALSGEDSQLLKSQITGLDVSGSDKRDMRYMVETHVTHYPKGKFKAIELVVWWSPKHGMIHRKVENKDLIRPLSDYGLWLNHGYAYHRSACEILKDIQEKANYTDKQVTDAADKAISQPGYIEDQSGFDAQNYLRVPTGMYEVKRGTKITFEQANMAPIIERRNEIDRLWEKAKIRLGFTDIFQGLEGGKGETLGGDRIRLNKAESRFRTLLDTFGIGFANTCKIQYELTDRNIPRKKLVMILGSAEYANTHQLFPKDSKEQFGMGIQANFNFFLAGKTQQEQEEEDALHNAFLNETIKTFGMQDKGVMWKSMQRKAELIDFKGWERIVPRPAEADNMSIDEVLERIESGETMLQPSPLMEPVQIQFYVFRVNAFKRTERYENYTDRQRVELERYLAKLTSIGVGANLARYENQAKSDPDVADALDQMMQQIGSAGASPGLPQGLQ